MCLSVLSNIGLCLWRTLDLLGLELQTVVNLHVGAGG